jgi:anthraniloyl-CoA monooxygenase
MKVVRGTNVYPRAIEAIVREYPEVDEFQTAITHAGIRDEITLRIELKPGWSEALSSFLSPLANVREDSYGGSLENRARFPLEVFDACRVVWPEAKPISVRISATDWVHGGFDPDQAVAFSRMLREHGCDIVDVSSGQVSPLERPAFGRSYQTPFADRIRNEVGIATIAVGAIASYDDLNTIVLAGSLRTTTRRRW